MTLSALRILPYNRPVDRRPIQQLSPSLVNRIAAGEVIERPAAVVKELVENSIDAGAHRIVVEVEDGGRALIRVLDDGSGIPPGDLALAFASHATSKLTCDDDLFRIGTMGFRGEALASIGAVSHARILSRIASSDAAWEIHNRGGAIDQPQAAAGNIGTTIEVRNLFFNTPARRKFIKGAPTEFGHISEALLRIALPHPTVSFHLSHNGRTALDLPASEAETRLLAAWPDDFREQRLSLSSGDAEMKVRGIIGLPELARPTAKYQYLYLNGRSIRDRFVIHALREAYRGLTEPGRHPAAILLLEMPPGDVDVNVHPTKSEVRFRDSGRVHGLILSAVRERLLGSDLSPRAIPMRANDESSRPDLREKLASFFKQLPPGVVAPAMQSSLPSATASRFDPASMSGPMRSRFDSAEASQSPPASSASSQFTGLDASAELTMPSSSLRNASASPITNAIQVHNSYLVAQSDDGMIIIDQHALHERIMYEELLARLTHGPLESQRMLIPQPIDVASTQMALLDQIQPLLNRLGIEVTPFGPGSVAVQSFPTFLERLDPASFVSELLERGEQELLDLHDEELLHGVLDMMACKAAVKAGDPLTPAEIEALLLRRDLVDRF
jgi:DNA mismatch repair protein MutL